MSYREKDKMGMIRKITFLAFTVVSATYVYKLLIEPHPIPIVEDEFWGPSSEQGKEEDTSITPFTINISAKVIDDLNSRLKRELSSNRLAEPLESVGFNYGFNSRFLKQVGKHWLEKYDWRKREKLLNTYPHYKTKIGGLAIHFQHIKPKPRNSKPPRPILVVHGWPGSFVEFQKIIPLLSEPKLSQHNYELVIPSLPGYGFSSAASRPGMSPTVMGSIFKILMKRLGHDKFFVMGGDWGAIIASDMATVYPKNIIAAQSSLCGSITVIAHIRYAIANMFQGILMTAKERSTVLPILEYVSFLTRESGYFHLQVTKPDTIGVGLSQSPLGLASYVLEKFSTWTNRSWIDREDGGVLENFTIDELLDNLMIYWVTGTATSSVRLYSEYVDPNRKYPLERVPTNVPFSCQYMPEDFAINPRFALHEKFRNIQKYEIAPRGGHFGAFEVPELVAENAISHFENY